MGETQKEASGKTETEEITMTPPDTKTPSKAAGKPETPRTDAVTVVPWTDGRMRKNDGSVDRIQDTENFYAPADFARTLERELAEAKATIADLYEGRTCVLPKTQVHAANLYTVALAILKTFGGDPEASLTAATQRIAELEAHAERLAGALETAISLNHVAERNQDDEWQASLDGCNSALFSYRAAKETK